MSVAEPPPALPHAQHTPRPPLLLNSTSAANPPLLHIARCLLAHAQEPCRNKNTPCDIYRTKNASPGQEKSLPYPTQQRVGFSPPTQQPNSRHELLASPSFCPDSRLSSIFRRRCLAGEASPLRCWRLRRPAPAAASATSTPRYPDRFSWCASTTDRCKHRVSS